MSKPEPFTFKPKWEIPGEIDGVHPPKNVLKAAEQAHVGLRYVSLQGPKPGSKRRAHLYAIWFPDPAINKRPEVSALRIAQFVTAMATAQAAKVKKRATYYAVFHGCPTAEEPKPRRACQFAAEAPVQEGDEEEEEGDEEEEEAEEEAEEEGDEEDEEGEEEAEEEGDEEDEEGDEEEELAEGLEVEEATIEWPQHQGPGMQPPGYPAPGYPAPGYPSPGNVAPIDPRMMAHPAYTGPMVGPMDPYAHEPYDPGKLFLRHLGGVFAETRATMREMRQDVREARAENKTANQRALELSRMSTQHYENMNRASQTGWDALHQGMTMQLNALQNSMAWERRLTTAQQAQQPGALMQGLQSLIPLILGLAGPILHAIKGGDGPPPQLLSPEVLGALMGGMGGPPPGAAPPPGAMPHVAMGPSPGEPTMPSMPPPAGFQAPGPPPPMGFGGAAAPSPPPSGVVPPVEPPGPQVVPFPQPGVPAAETPVVPQVAPGPAGPAQPPPQPPPGPDVPPTGNPPILPVSFPTPPNPFQLKPLTAPLGAGPLAQMPSESLQPPPVPDATAPPQDAALHERFTRAPLGMMCHTLLTVIAPTATAPRVHAAAGPAIMGLLGQCSNAMDDQDVVEPLKSLYRELSKPDAMPTILAELQPEPRALLSDIYLGISQHLGRELVSDATPPSTPEPATASSDGESSPSPDTSTQQALDSEIRKPPKRRKEKRKKRKKRPQR